ncbi:MAG: Rne/Rng family ribonuclease [Thermodesulfobacteriota bacterium]|nr:Rne/Rng family ribonuclease [Thermodesulfobacteriota bacterium]
MTKKMLINTIDEEESRMAVVEDGNLVEYNVRMSVREPTTGNIYNGTVQNVHQGLRAAFVDYGAGKSGFLPLRDVAYEYFNENRKLSAGKRLPVQVIREEKGSKGAMLTTHISLPGRYLVLMPNRQGSGGISRKIENEADRKRLKWAMEQITDKEDVGFIVRTAGMNRTKQELVRDYQMLLRLWKDIKEKSKKTTGPGLIYQETDFAVRAFRDYYTSDINEILVDDPETARKMRAYCRAVSPRNVRMIKFYKEEVPLFDQYDIEAQINEIYQRHVNLKSGGSIVIEPTEAGIVIDVNSGRSNKRNVEETAYKANMEAAEEIARQLRLRDLGGLIVVDFIDMMDKNHITQVEKTFRDALKVDRSRIQMAKISRFGMMELSRQKKQSTIQEISYAICPYCKGRGVRPSVEYLALSAFRRIKSEAVKGQSSEIDVTLPPEVTGYLLNQKRSQISKLEALHDASVTILGDPVLLWGEFNLKKVKRTEAAPEVVSDESAGEGAKPAVVRSTRRRRRPRQTKPISASHPETPEKDPGQANVVTTDKSVVTEPPAVSEKVNSSTKKEGIVGRFYDLFFK